MTSDQYESATYLWSVIRREFIVFVGFMLMLIAPIVMLYVGFYMLVSPDWGLFWALGAIAAGGLPLLKGMEAMR